MVLRESERIRLVFRPLLVDNPHDKKAALKGTFLYQKKSANDERIGFDTISLQKVRQGEGYKLNLSTSEVLQLFQELSALYELHKQMGVPPTYALSLTTVIGHENTCSRTCDAVLQVLGYRDRLQQNYLGLTQGQEDMFDAFLRVFKGDEYVGFYYPDVDNLFYDIQSPTFDTLEACRDWVDEQSRVYNQDGITACALDDAP